MANILSCSFDSRRDPGSSKLDSYCSRFHQMLSPTAKCIFALSLCNESERQRAETLYLLAKNFSTYSLVDSFVSR